ncbi:MAG: hypothetical protein ACRDO4_14800 [Nocardioides sp.]
MSDQRGSEVRTGLRALGSPVAVLCLVLLVLNDHLLKQAWPGWVTGKLSDVVGLVVAPLLLGVALAAVGVRRPLTWSSGLVALGFVATKTTAAGAAAASAAWSLTGIDTHIVADPTDLLALPAVLVARVVWLQAGRPGGQRRLAAVLGLAVLPFGVLATAATSPCNTDEGVTSADVVDGRISGDGERRAVVVLEDHAAWRVVDATGEVSTLPEIDRDRMGDSVRTFDGACAVDALTCWRITLERDAVQLSTDGGRSWRTELAVTDEQREASLDGVEESCGEEPEADLSDLAVLDTDSGPLVAVSARHAGAWLRDAPGEWRLLDRTTLAGGPSPSAGTERASGWLKAVPPVVPPYAPPGESPPEPITPGPPTCPPRERDTITPHPANGEPFEVCT